MSLIGEKVGTDAVQPNQRMQLASASKLASGERGPTVCG
jgi:hypothetical protein